MGILDKRNRWSNITTNRMTQTGQQNHYDIKYLHGYGSQISVKNQRIVLKNGIDSFRKNFIILF